MVDVFLAGYNHGEAWKTNASGHRELTIKQTAFDPQLIGQLYAAPRFQQDFGYEYEPGKWVIRASWQSGLSMGSPIGQVVGAFFAAYPMEWFGRKLTFGACGECHALTFRRGHAERLGCAR